jgi:hypothetical protein
MDQFIHGEALPVVELEHRLELDLLKYLLLAMPLQQSDPMVASLLGVTLEETKVQQTLATFLFQLRANLLLL